MDVFKDYAYYYNVFYQEKDYEGEAVQVDILLKKYGKDISKIINYGCGTGRHDVELTKLGYRCSGIDISPVMIGLAQENAWREHMDIEFTAADIRTYNPETKYDAVVSLFHVMSYQCRNEDVLSAFRAARKALEFGGIFLFDAWYGPGVLSDKPAVRVKEAVTEKDRLVRIARPVMHDKINVVDVHYEIFVVDRKTDITRTFNEIHSMRYFFRPELEILLEMAGFELLDNMDCRTLGETDYDTWTSYFVARAVK